VPVATYHHGDLLAALVEAGLALLEEGGLDALTVRAAARRVGVSHAAPSRHFRHADEFLAAIAAAGYRRLFEQLTAASIGRNALDGFREMGRAYVQFALDHRELYRVMFHPSLADKSQHPELEIASAAAFEILRSGITAVVSAGFVVSDANDRLALTLWSAVHGLATLLLDGQLAAKGYQDDPDGRIDDVLDTLFAGLARR
jgi:AcrR family transcriptional regulator